MEDFARVYQILSKHKLDTTDWYYVYVFLQEHKEETNYYTQLIYILMRCSYLYMKNLTETGHNICLYKTCKMFISWLGYPSYFSDDYLKFLIMSTMKSNHMYCIGCYDVSHSQF
jgi:hypothetical protein